MGKDELKRNVEQETRVLTVRRNAQKKISPHTFCVENFLEVVILSNQRKGEETIKYLGFFP